MNRLPFTPVLFLATLAIFIPTHGIGTPTEYTYFLTVETSDGNWEEPKGIFGGRTFFRPSPFNDNGRLVSFMSLKPNSRDTYTFRSRNPHLLDSVNYVETIISTNDPYDRSFIEVKHLVWKSLADGTEKRLCASKDGRVQTPVKISTFPYVNFDMVC